MRKTNKVAVIKNPATLKTQPLNVSEKKMLEYVQAGGEIIKGLGSLFGGGGYSAKDARKAGLVAIKNAEDSAKRLPIAMKEGWEKAGIHPVYGMGGSSSSFSSSFPATSEDSVGEKMQSMGQGLSRAAEALTSRQERLQTRMMEAQVEGQELENVKKAADARLATLSAPPGIAAPEGSKSISALPGHPGMEAASSPAIKKYNLGRGGTFYAPTAELGEALEGMGHIGGSIAGADILLRGVLPEYIRDLKESIQESRAWQKAKKGAIWNDPIFKRKKGG